MINTITSRSLWFQLSLIILLPIIGMVLGVGITFLFGMNQAEYSKLIVNLFFLLACIVLVCLFNFSSEDLGLKIIKDQTGSHMLLSLGIFMFYLLFYIFVIRISVLKPFSSGTVWGLLTYLIVSIAEEFHFRGILYTFFERHFSARTALIVTSILFGLFHAQQGLRGIVSKVTTGWLWGSVRYSTGMIFLLIFPIHFAYNSIWLLFEGNWANPPMWAIYVLPAVEFLFGLVIIMIKNKRSQTTVHYVS